MHSLPKSLKNMVDVTSQESGWICATISVLEAYPIMHLVLTYQKVVPNVSLASESTPETNILNIILVIWLLLIQSFSKEISSFIKQLCNTKWSLSYYFTVFLWERNLTMSKLPKFYEWKWKKNQHILRKTATCSVLFK